MRTFSFRPALTLRARAPRGPGGGWEGKPLHPPLTDVPVGAYVLAAAFDVISFVAGDDQPWARDFYRAASFVLIGGAAVSVLAALTGLWDWRHATEPGTEVRRIANAHAMTMVTVTALVAAGIAVRAAAYWDEPSTPLLAMCLSIAAAMLTGLGGALGGSLVFDHGLRVETAADTVAGHGPRQPPEQQEQLDLSDQPARTSR